MSISAFVGSGVTSINIPQAARQAQAWVFAHSIAERLGGCKKPTGSEVKYILKDFATGYLLLEKTYAKDSKSNRYEFVQEFSMQDLDYQDADVFKFLAMGNTRNLFVTGLGIK